MEDLDWDFITGLLFTGGMLCYFSVSSCSANAPFVVPWEAAQSPQASWRPYRWILNHVRTYHTAQLLCRYSRNLSVQELEQLSADEWLDLWPPQSTESKFPWTVIPKFPSVNEYIFDKWAKKKNLSTEKCCMNVQANVACTVKRALSSKQDQKMQDIYAVHLPFLKDEKVGYMCNGWVNLPIWSLQGHRQKDQQINNNWRHLR